MNMGGSAMNAGDPAINAGGEKADVVVIGGGLAGLTAAYQLKKRGIDVRVLESSSRTGGVVSSIRVDGFELDLGPNSLVLTPALEGWIKELKLETARLDAAASSKRRFLIKDKTLFALSPHPIKLLKSPYLSWGAKGRILTERFRGRSTGSGRSGGMEFGGTASGGTESGGTGMFAGGMSEDESLASDESVASFFTRRLGREISDAIADPIFSGIYAGDIDLLSVNEVLPRMVQWEREYGSLTKGVFRQKEAMKSGRTIINFAGGLEQLTKALAAPLEGAIYTKTLVENITSGPRGYRVTYQREAVGQNKEAGGQDGSGRDGSEQDRSEQDGRAYDGSAQILEAKHLIYAAPAYSLPSLPWFAELKEAASAISYASVRTVHLALRREDLELPDGFGFLVPTREHLSLLGCIFTSAIFPSKSPEGSVLLTLMLGGAHRADDLRQDADKLQETALKQLQEILHISSPVRVLHEQTWLKAIPQKNRGYAQIKQSLRAFEQAHPGFYFAGNAISGVSVGDTMEYATQVARSILSVTQSV
jgi:oxygen-dependent protoporphyrinogen oxidase